MALGNLDIVLLILSLLLSAVVGVYYSVMGRKSTPLEYLLGGRTMQPFPLALSLMVGTVSAITIMGNAGEMYTYGTQIWVMDLGMIGGFVIIAKLFIPVMYPLQLVSLYQYVEYRFRSKWLRQATVFLQLVGAYLYTGFLLFPPSLALQSMTSLDFFINIIIIGVSCTLYSTFGGVKAVVYADSLQAFVMLVGVLAIVIQGAVNFGGMEKIMDIAYHGERIEFFNLSFDPYQRHSFWLCVILGFFFALSNNGVNQSQVQRYFSTGNVKNAQWVLYYSGIALLILRCLIHLSGLVMYAHFKDCDPVGQLKTDPAHVLVIYVIQELTKIPGLTGLFVAAVYAAVLSSVSTQLNSMTALIWEDFLKVLSFFQNWTQVKIGYLQKTIVFFSGVVSILIGLALSQLGWSFLRTVLALNGAISGPLIGLFLTALFLPWVTAKGATAGFVFSIVFNVVIVSGQLTLPEAPYLPMSYDGCPAPPQIITNITITDPTTTINTTTLITTTPPPSQPKTMPGEWLFGLSYCLNSLWGTMLCLLISLLVSAITGFNTTEDVDKRLINPRMWQIFQRSLKLQAKELFYAMIRRPAENTPSSTENKDGEVNMEEEAGIPLNNHCGKDGMRDNKEIDAKSIV